ncbi:ankyrin repeat-containing domain protein [Dactylonectria macrodidyma]|uniref:Ankyrin repeat-containing domain protein n=1 Tax=Dactylonectria macrodidyma TaxID=307937 RepID=A0A9P9J3E8_9HYPO|nr:ankyrin repeat-containing domain protein [Dactylonectria macrodidyma]
MCLGPVFDCLDRDIGCYIDYQLDHDPEFRRRKLKPSFKQTIRESLRVQANGMFLWIRCQFDEIAKLKTVKYIREALSSLPEGLYDTYENILVKVPKGNVRIVRQLLQWLVYNVSNLSLAELRESLAIEPDKDHINEEALLESPEDIGELCPGLIVVIDEGVASLAHLSVRNYLLSDRIKSSRASAFAFPEAEANGENALSCLAYLTFAELRSGPADSADDFEARLLRRPFLDHASRCWAAYAHNANSSSEELCKHTLQFFSLSCRTNFMSWVQVLCSRLTGSRADEYMTTMEQQKHRWDSYPKHATSLYYAASFGLEHVVRALIAQGAEINAAGGRLGATAFHAAALRSHVKVMDILFQKGADPNRADAIKVTPLHSAASMGNAEVIRFLLEHGTDPKAKDAWMRTPYDIVRLAGRVDALNYLEIIKPFSC